MPLQEKRLATEASPPTTVAEVSPSTTGGELSGKATRDPGGSQEPAYTTTTYYSTRIAHDAPVSLALSFSRVAVAGHRSSLYVQIKNLTRFPIEQIDVLVESHGFESSVSEQIDRLPPEQLVRLLVQLDSARSGVFVMQCSVKLKTQNRRKGFIGSRSIYINPIPDPAKPLDTGAIFTNSEIAVAGGAPDPRGEPLRRVPGVPQFRDLNELLQYKLPEKFQSLVLSQEFDEDTKAADNYTRQQSRYLVIDRMFLGYVQPGTLLCLTPTDPGQSLPVHLVARPQFRLGRSRDLKDGADLITWFMPRSRANDEKTRHLSRVHVLAEIQGGQVFLRDNESESGSTYDGQPLTPRAPEQMRRKAVLSLSSEYFVEVQRMASAYSGGLQINNISLWKGPDLPLNPCGGAVRFSPLNSELAHHDALWLLTDAAFGTSRSNALVLNAPGLAEIQGRFHHHRGCFWVENRVANDAVRINFQVLNENGIAPLMNGLVLQLGNLNYRVEVLA
jgi:pSer/pThr/pTyr-binding forkhead associated (FHA) protein